MSRPHLHHDTLAPAVLPGRPYTRYLVVRQEDVWFIKFDGEEYGPYETEREAMFFAIDAAHKLGDQGEETQVLQLNDNGEALSVWTYGRDPYPARQ
jgi:hypothetical protein